MILDVLDHIREPAVGRMRTFMRLQVARNAREADDAPARIAQRLLARQAPARLPAGIQMQFELIGQLMAGVDRRHVLLEIAAAEATREHLVRGLAEQVALFLVAAAHRQRAIDKRIAAVCILHEKRDIRQCIEHGFEHPEVCEHRAKIGVVGLVRHGIGRTHGRYGK